jgi:hypothetical protein
MWFVGFQEVKAPGSSRHSRTMKVVRSSPLRTGRLHPQEFPWYSFLEAESNPGHMVPLQLRKKSPATPLGIDPETPRLIAQCPSHYATSGPKSRYVSTKIYGFTFWKVAIFVIITVGNFKPHADISVLRDLRFGEHFSLLGCNTT